MSTQADNDFVEINDKTHGMMTGYAWSAGGRIQLPSGKSTLKQLTFDPSSASTGGMLTDIEVSLAIGDEEISFIVQ